MNLLAEIETAQRVATIEYDTVAGRGCHLVFEAMTPAAQAAWRSTEIPDEFLVCRDTSFIKRFADKCGMDSSLFTDHPATA